jgi:hypothetical protein
MYLETGNYVLTAARDGTAKRERGMSHAIIFDDA